MNKMNEIYIAKNNEDVLTRTSLVVGNEKYIIESPYSDENTMDLLFKCIEAYCTAHNFSKSDIVSEIKNILSKTTKTNKYSSWNKEVIISIMIEAYDKRYIVIKEHIYDVIRNVIEMFISANIQATWNKDLIFNYLQEYVDEYEEDLEELEK